MSVVFTQSTSNYLSRSGEIWTEGDGAGTILLWVNNDDTDTQYILDYDHDGGSDRNRILKTSSIMRHALVSNGNVRNADANPTIPTGQWDAVIILFDKDAATETYCYYNGDTATNGNTIVAFSASSSPIFHLGKSSAGFPYDGNVGHLAIWKEALGSTTITALLGGANPLDISEGTTNLFDYWTFESDEGAGPYVGENGNELAVTGTVAWSSSNPTIDAPAGGGSIAPTSTIYGPLVGPLGGPV